MWAENAPKSSPQVVKYRYVVGVSFCGSFETCSNFWFEKMMILWLSLAFICRRELCNTILVCSNIAGSLENCYRGVNSEVCSRVPCASLACLSMSSSTDDVFTARWAGRTTFVKCITSSPRGPTRNGSRRCTDSRPANRAGWSFLILFFFCHPDTLQSNSKLAWLHSNLITSRF